jgi:membrane protein YqaA with SNARE-associated domain
VGGVTAARRGPLRRVYDWLLRLCSHRHAMPALAAVSFADSSFFPIPPDAMLVPMTLARPDRAWRIAYVCTAASVAGGLLGYAIGFFAYESFGRALIEFYGYGEDFEIFRELFQRWGLAIILVKGLTPIPYKVVTIASGFAGYDVWIFLVASIVSRGIRFYVEAALLRAYGDEIRGAIDRYLALFALGFFILIVGGILFARYVV